MRVVGYVREGPSEADAEPAFVQGEALRRWVRTTGHKLVSVCQDVRQEAQALSRDGYQALLGILESGGADAVVVPDLETLSPNLMIQEIMMWDLERRGVPLLSADERDHRELLSPPKERLLVRDVLAQLGGYYEWAHPVAAVAHEEDGDGEVVVQLIPAEGQ
jgi:DNA invertase Pin-like site-specific DNA recombinase